MKNKVYHIGDTFENDTYYSVEDTLYYTPAETVAATKQEYLSISPNNLDHLDTCIYLYNKKNITLDFCGNTLLMQGRIQPIIIDRCENITIKNCVAEFETSFSTEFEIMETGDDYILMKINEKQNCKVVDGTIIPYGTGWENHNLSKGFHFLACFDKKGNPRGQILFVLGNHPEYDKNCVHIPTEYLAEQVGDLIKLKGPVEDAWRVGDILIEESEPRYRSGVNILDSKNITIENHRILNGVGMGINAHHTKDITIKGLRMFPDERSHGIVANSADAIHSFACSGKFVIEDCNIEAIIDDFINIHGNYLRLGKIISNTKIECEVAARGLSAYCNVLDVGDEVLFHKGTTMAEREYNAIKEKRIIDKRTIEFELEKPIGRAMVGDIVENLSGNSEVTVRNCNFLKANSHMRFQTRGRTIVEDCSFDVPILLTGDSNFWFESNPCMDLTVRRCRFNTDRANIRIIPEFDQSEEAPYYHHNIKVLDNSFKTETAMEGNGAENIEFFGNKNTDGNTFRLKLAECADVKTDNAEIC